MAETSASSEIVTRLRYRAGLCVPRLLPLHDILIEAADEIEHLRAYVAQQREIIEACPGWAERPFVQHVKTMEMQAEIERLRDRACRDGIVVLEQLRSELNAAYSRINELTGLLRSLLVDCDNWGTAPDDRYREALS